MIKKVLILNILFCVCLNCMADVSGQNALGISKPPVLYMPFENSNDSYGAGTGSNPAWINNVNSEYPVIVDRGVSLWPLTGNNNGIKGDYFDGTSLNGGNDLTNILTFNDVSNSTVSELSELKSFTVTFWVRTGSDTAKGTQTYILNGPIQVLFVVDGRMSTHYWPNLDWSSSDVDDYMSYGEWLFVAIVIDQNGIKYYRGDVGNAPILVSETVASTGTSKTNPSVYVGSRSYVGATYMNYDLDELRIWGDKTDNSGALSLIDIEAVWQYDYSPSFYCGDELHSIPAGDFTKNCFVDIEDLTIFLQYWLLSETPNIDAMEIDSLDRIFPDIRPSEIDRDKVAYHVPKGSKVALTFAVKYDVDTACYLRVTSIVNQNNEPFNGEIHIYEAQSVPVEANNNGCSATAVGVIPDSSVWPYFIRMAPFEIAEVLKSSDVVNLTAGEYSGVVLEFDTSADAVAGTYEGWMEFWVGNQIRSVPFEFTIHDVVIPANDFALNVDYWLDADPVNLTTATAPVWWSAEHWSLLEQAGQTLRYYGNNGIFTPTIYTSNPLVAITKRTDGTYTFNFNKFDQWAQMYFDMGFEYLEGEHLCARADGLPLGLIYGYNQAYGYTCPIIDRNITMTNWHSFLTSFGQSLYTHLQNNGWVDKYKQHIMDEPGDAPVLATAYAVIKAAMPEVQTLDAIHSWGQDPANFSASTDNFIFYIDLLADNQALAQQRLTEGRANWLYYFCKPDPPKPHPTMDAHLTMCRLYPLLCYKYNATGMIFWAANRYRGANPYTSSIGPLPGGSQNPGHPAGDCWTFYPTDEGLVGSVRMLNLRDGLVDHQLLTMLKSVDSQKADELLDGLVRSMSDYERYDNSKYYDFRKLVLNELESYK